MSVNITVALAVAMQRPPGGGMIGRRPGERERTNVVFLPYLL
jgi:hypothetical protein